VSSATLSAPGMPNIGRARSLAAFAALALAAWLGTYEIARIIGNTPVDGVTYPASSIYGLTGIGSPSTALSAWSKAACSGLPIRGWLYWLLGFDIAFIVGYVGVLLGADARWRLGIRAWVGVLVVADVAENIVSGFAVAHMPSDPSGGTCSPTVVFHVPVLVFGTLDIATTVKWLAVGVIAVKSIFQFARPGELRGRLALTTHALGLQRFLLIVVLVLSVLLIVPGSEILDQGVDVERSWLLTDSLGRGVTLFAFALASMGLLASTLRYLSSVHVGGAGPDDAPLETEPQTVVQARAALADPSTRWWERVLWWGRAAGASLRALWRWGLAVAIVLLAALVLDWTAAATVYWTPVVCVVAVLAAVPLLSAALACIKSPSLAVVVEPGQLRRQAWKVGRLLAWSVLPILLLSTARAYVAPMILGYSRVLCLGIVVVATAAACGIVYQVLTNVDPPKLVGDEAFAVSSTAFAAVHPQMVGARTGTGRTASISTAVPGRSQTVEPPQLAASILPAVVATVFGAVVLMFFPLHVARVFGALGVIALCLSALSAFYATMAIAAQAVDPPHVFRVMAMRRTPVIGLVLAIAILSTFLAAGGPLHAIRPRPTAAEDTRPTLDAAFQTWLTGAQGCAIDDGRLPDGRKLHVRPMLFVAAEGGGIRAAWWTVDAMTSLASTACGRNSVFLASGVSGGATGLAVMATSHNPYGDMRKLAGQDALAAATEGLMARDLVAGLFGVNARALDGPPDDHYPDRAALMEYTWEGEEPGLKTPFPIADPIVPWRTVFNGTSVVNNCRVLVGDVAPGAQAASCNGTADPVPSAYDLFTAQPCDVGIRTTTASLLAARFPYVTPSGVISDCNSAKFSLVDQIIDGGYSENSGIATINSMLTLLMPAIRQRNATAAASTGDVTVVLPMVVFLHNKATASAGAVTKPGKASPEVVIPAAGGLSDAGILGTTATLLSASQDITGDWLAAGTGNAAEIRATVDGQFTSRTMTVAPQQSPQVALPLGWTLSQATRTSLDRAFDAYVSCVPEGQRTCGASAEFDQLLARWQAPPCFPLPAVKNGVQGSCPSASK
jgi:hypothetical protein